MCHVMNTFQVGIKFPLDLANHTFFTLNIDPNDINFLTKPPLKTPPSFQKTHNNSSEII